MRGPLKLMSLLAIAALLALPAVAHAASSGSGNSAVDEYTEAVPAPGGDHSSSQGGGGSGGGSLPAQSVSNLKALGKDGVEAAGLAQATAPSVGDSGGGGSSGTGFVLPLILIASFLAAVAVFVRRHQGATSG